MGFKHKRQEKKKRKKGGARAAHKIPQGNFAKQKKGIRIWGFPSFGKVTSSLNILKILGAKVVRKKDSLRERTYVRPRQKKKRRITPSLVLLVRFLLLVGFLGHLVRAPTYGCPFLCSTQT